MCLAVNRRVALGGATVLLMLAAFTSGVSNAAYLAPLQTGLLKPGDMVDFAPGRPQTFRTPAEVRNGSGEPLPRPTVARLESEGFAEAALARIHGRAERSSKGVSKVFRFESPAGAFNEMHIEAEQQFTSGILPKQGRRYFTFERAKISALPGAEVFAVTSNQAAAEVGVESGVAEALVVSGSCLFSLGIYRPASREARKPVVEGIRAISGRGAAAGC